MKLFQLIDNANGYDYIFIGPADRPIGEAHDVLMKMKGHCVQKMMDAQKDEEAISAKIQEIDNQT